MKLNNPLKKLIRVFVIALLVITTYLLIDGKINAIMLATENMFTSLTWKSKIIEKELNKYKPYFERCEDIEKFDSIYSKQLIEIKNYLEQFKNDFKDDGFQFFIAIGKDSITHKIEFHSTKVPKIKPISKLDKELFSKREIKELVIQIFFQLKEDNSMGEFVGVFSPLCNNNIRIISSLYTPAGSWLEIIKKELVTNLLVLLLVIGITFYFTYRSLRRIVKSEEEIKKELIRAGEIIQEKNIEITDSIKYAKRLQSAIQMPIEKLKALNPESFIFYQPKDIVAGDFYWVHHTEKTFYIAAADCTGHGVPGAMVSMLCINLLNKVVKEIPEVKPDGLLNEICKELQNLFKTGAEEIKDGMDLSLLAFNKSTKQISWSGAFNPLWIVDCNKNFTELKGDRQSVSGIADIQPFTLHEFDAIKGNWYYLFTDGYADQFGGEKNKKFRYKQLQELIVSNIHESASYQHNVLQETFIKWKGKGEQVDDVLVLGINFDLFL